jgi:hypothetical protein
VLGSEGAQEASNAKFGGLARAYVTGKAPTLASEVPCSRAVQGRLWALRSKTSPTFFGGLTRCTHGVSLNITHRAGCASLVTLPQNALRKLLTTLRVHNIQMSLFLLLVSH